ncbi:unnamed protein product, partial [Allacma fusca]
VCNEKSDKVVKRGP